MEAKSMRCLTNSISRFILLVSCQTLKTLPTQEDFECAATLLKHFKPVLDEIDDDKIPSDANLRKECEDLDFAVNAAREFLEHWSPKLSRIVTVLRSEKLLIKIRSSCLEICCILCRLLRTSQSSSSLAGVQVCTEIMHCIQEFQSWHPERISKHIEQALMSKTDKIGSPSENLAEVVEFLGLLSNEELLKESIAVERERMKVHANKLKEEADQINQIIDLLALIRDYLLKTGSLGSINGVPIPSYFRCPLSLDFMLDPVIVASGQTFERSSIQKWLEHGLRICPKTRQYLSHTNVIPNYTVKALIANWLEDNNLKLPSSSESVNVNVKVKVKVNSEAPVSDLSSQDSSDSMSRSSLEAPEVGPRLKVNEPSVYTHSRTQSASSAVSSSEYLPSMESEMSRITSERVTSPSSNSLSGRGSHSAKVSTDVSESRSNSYTRVLSLPTSDSEYDDTTTSSRVDQLVEDLKSQSHESQTTAASKLRLLAKHNKENRVIIGKCGAIKPLITLLNSDVKITQENAVTALLNLSLNEENKARIGEAGVIEPLIHVLKSGTDQAKENSAAALFSLSLLEEYKLKIGRSGAIKALVDLLALGTVKGKKDAITALFNLSICHENKARIVQAGAVKHLVQLLEPSRGMVDKSVALLANLSTISEGRSAIAKEGGIPLIVEIVDMGTQRGKENAASVLLQMCLNSNKFCNLVLQEGAVPPLVALSQSGTPRAREKAQQLLSHFRNQREGASGKKKK